MSGLSVSLLFVIATRIVESETVSKRAHTHPPSAPDSALILR
jgi:hypothetical protein